MEVYSHVIRIVEISIKLNVPESSLKKYLLNYYFNTMTNFSEFQNYLEWLLIPVLNSNKDT
jgi:hypothetical protein